MTTDSFLKAEQSGANPETSSRASSSYSFSPGVRRHAWPAPPDSYQFRWGLYQKTDPVAVAFGRMNFSDLASRFARLLKLERQHRERLAAVSLNPAARELLSVLDQETSIRWEDLPNKAEGEWSEVSRSAALLAGANLCEVSSTRIRLNEYGVKLLAQSSSSD